MAYLPHTEKEIAEMLKEIGVSNVEDLFSHIPEAIRKDGALNLDSGMDEMILAGHLKSLSSMNTTSSEKTSFLGSGAYRHYIPACVSELASRTEFVTPYTPYQPEISQGTLQVLFEYQTMISGIFGMDVSNASHYSGATALADACLMARKVGRKKNKIIIADSVHPEYRNVLRTVLCVDDDIITVASKDGAIDRETLKSKITDETAAVVAAYPNFFGIVEDLRDVADLAHDKGALFITSTPEPLALGILTPPGDFGADVATGEGLSFGLPVCFGGPTLGIFTAREKLVRNMPGRICGRTVDVDGKRSYTLTLSTREQHIRREKATSNICSNQALCATTATIYLASLGKHGLKSLSELNASKANYAKGVLASVDGIKIAYEHPTFNEFVIECSDDANDVLESLSEKGISAGVLLSKWYPGMKNHILVCFTELNSKDEIDLLREALSGCHSRESGNPVV